MSDAALARLLRDLAPRRRPGEFVVTVADVSPPPDVAVHASVVEDEGRTVVLARADADRLGLAYDYVAAWITLQVRSELAAVGLTAAVSRALADAGISANVLAAFHHDHLLVPADRAGDAVRVLEELQRRAR